MKGYKGFDSDLKCRGYQYEVGKTYEMEGQPELCERGFHFCESIRDCEKYYKLGSRYAEIEAFGDVVRGEGKLATNKIRVVRELTVTEVNRAYYSYGDGYDDGYGDGKNIQKVLIFKED